MPQVLASRKKLKHYFYSLVSNSRQRKYRVPLVYVTFNVIYPAMFQKTWAGFAVLLRIGNTAGRQRKEILINRALVELVRVACAQYCLLCIGNSPLVGSASPHFGVRRSPRRLQAARTIAQCRCGRCLPPGPPSRRSSAQQERTAADPAAAAPDYRHPASAHNPYSR
jgi:hypothetical protein